MTSDMRRIFARSGAVFLCALLIVSISFASKFYTRKSGGGGGDGFIFKRYPPIAKRIPFKFQVQDETFVDHYHWMRNDSDPAVSHYISLENEYTAYRVGSSAPLRFQILTEIRTLDESRTGINIKAFYQWSCNGYNYYEEEEEESSYKRYYRWAWGKSFREKSLIFDSSRLADVQFEVGFFEVSPQSDFIAIGYDVNGSEHFKLAFVHIESQVIFDTVEENTYYSGRWSKDGEIFYVSVLDEYSVPTLVKGFSRKDLFKVGVKVFQEADPAMIVSVEQTNDLEYVLIYSSSLSTSETYIINAFSVQTVKPRVPGILYKIDHHPDYGFFRISNEMDGSNFAIYNFIAFNESSRKVIVPAQAGLYLTRLELFREYMVVWYWQSSQKGFKVLKISGFETIFVYPRGDKVYSMYPSIIPDEEARLIRDFNATYFTFSNSSYAESRALYSLNFESGKIKLIAKESYSVDATSYKEFKEYVPIEDGKGQSIPVSIVYKSKDGGRPVDRPMILRCYGAYGGMIEPGFDVAYIPMLERGFVIAFAHVRGDADLGHSWYLDGKLDKKENSISDFLLVIDHFLRNGWTSSHKLAIYGRSAGGVVIGAAINRLQPGKIKCAVAQVPFVDVIGSMIDATVPWTKYEWEEWGNPLIDPNILSLMKRYSPYENVGKREYPNVLLMGSLNDTRVGYFEPTKFVAKLRFKCQCPNRLILLQIKEGGHIYYGDSYFQDLSFIFSFILQSFTKD